MKPITRQEYLNLSPKEQEKYYSRIEPDRTIRYYSREMTSMSAYLNQSYVETPGWGPTMEIEADLAYIEGFLSNPQYLSQSRRYRNIQIAYNKQQRENNQAKNTIQKLNREIDDLLIRLNNNRTELQNLVGISNSKDVDIQNLRNEIAGLKKKLRTKKK